MRRPSRKSTTDTHPVMLSCLARIRYGPRGVLPRSPVGGTANAGPPQWGLLLTLYFVAAMVRSWGTKMAMMRSFDVANQEGFARFELAFGMATSPNVLRRILNMSMRIEIT